MSKRLLKFIDKKHKELEAIKQDAIGIAKDSRVGSINEEKWSERAISCWKRQELLSEIKQVIVDEANGTSESLRRKLDKQWEEMRRS